VGQGDAIFLRLESGESLLVDGGPPFRRGAPVNRSLEQLAVDKVNHILLTHPDRDHLGGLPSLIRRHRADTLWLRSSQLSDKRLLPLLAAAEQASLPVRFLEKSEPKHLHCRLPPFSGNEASPLCFARLAGNSSIWLTGDSGFRAENWLLRTGPLPKADYLKVGHHGSKYSSSLEFLRASGARTALISVGRKNRYGHPAPAALARLQEAGMGIQRTDQEGTTVFY
jgi:beta-lactamase superfamily II metal-dependent hydrolase